MPTNLQLKATYKDGHKRVVNLHPEYKGNKTATKKMGKVVIMSLKEKMTEHAKSLGSNLYSADLEEDGVVVEYFRDFRNSPVTHDADYHAIPRVGGKKTLKPEMV